MKFIVTADIHLHPYRQCSHDVGRDRLEDGLSVLRQTLEAARERGCPWVFLGDLKNVKGVWHQEALNRALAILEEFKDVDKNMVHGNHDGVGGGSGLLPFRNGHTTVIDKPIIMGSAGAFWPHSYDVSKMPEFLQEAKAAGAKVLFGHILLIGSIASESGMPIPKGERLEHIGLGEDRIFDWAFLGDVHKAQTLGSEDDGIAIYPGSPLALNWGERELDKGCLYVDTSKPNAVELVKTKAPRFRVFDLIDHKPPDLNVLRDCKGDFARVLVGPRADMKMVEELREASGARWFQAIVRRESDVEKRSEIHAGMTRQKMIEEYVEVRPLEGFEKGKLVAVGMNLMEEG